MNKRYFCILFMSIGIQLQVTAATFNISTTNEFREALKEAAINGENDVIILSSGIYKTFGNQFSFVTNENKSLLIQGNTEGHSEHVILDGEDISRVLFFDCIGSCGKITLKDITIQKGNAINQGQVSPAYSRGGGIWAAYSIAKGSTLSNVKLIENSSEFGGAVYTSGQGWIAISSSFSGNQASYQGGAIGTDYDWTMIDSDFDSNVAKTGGAIYASTGRVIIKNSIFKNNSANSGSGGAIYTGIVSAIGSVFSKNSAIDGNGGAIYTIVSGPVTANLIINSSFSENTTSGVSPRFNCFDTPCDATGSAVYLSGTSSSIINSIFYGQNTPLLYSKTSYNLYNNLINIKADIGGNTPLAVDNIERGNESPFVDISNENYRLKPDSLAIDAGLDFNSTVFGNLVSSSNIEGQNIVNIRITVEKDLEKNIRPAPNTRVDLGVYEYNSIPGLNNEDCFFSWAEARYSELFPKASETKVFETYNYRHYATTNTYLANKIDSSEIWGIFPTLGLELTNLGLNEVWFTRAEKDNCK